MATIKARILKVLRDCKTVSLTATELSKKLREKPATVSGILKKLVDAGTLARVPGGPRWGWLYHFPTKKV